MSTINRGDLVIVVGTYCRCQAQDIGIIAPVENLSVEGTQCVLCKVEIPPTMTVEIVNAHDGRHAWKPLAIVRKIEPLAEDESVESGEVVTA